MAKRKSYYENMAADFSRCGPVDGAAAERLVDDFERFVALRSDTLPELVTSDLKRIESENREWWPARCAVIRKGRWDLLGRESAADFAYLCQDGPFFGNDPRGKQVAANWGAILCQQGCSLIWPVVMFAGETIFFEWSAIDDETGETVAAGNVTFLRRGHAGGCYVKTEHLSFYRDVSAAPALLTPAL